MSRFEIPELAVPFVFGNRPASIPPDLRPDWRIGIILLLLRQCCRDNRSSFARLHVLNWSIRSSDGQRQLEELLIGTADPGSITVRIEPALNRAVDFARGENLLTIINGDRVALTSKGVNLAEDIAATNDIFESEKLFISRIKKRLTEDLVKRLLRPNGGI